MSNNLICRTKEFNATHPCFVDDRVGCVAVTIKECGLDLEGISENKQTKKLFETAQMTGLSTILSFEDAMKFAKREVHRDFDIDHFHPAAETYEIMYRTKLYQEADRFYKNAKALIQKMKDGPPSK